MTFPYGQGYPAMGIHTPPGRPLSFEGAPYGNPSGFPGQGVPYGAGGPGRSYISPGGPVPGGPYLSVGGPVPGGPYLSAGGPVPGGSYLSAGGPVPCGSYLSAGGPAPGGPYGGYGAAPPVLSAFGFQPPAGAIPPGMNTECYRLFQSVDTDHSGSISQTELKEALINSDWSKFSDETCCMMINMFDRTGTRSLDMAGFSALWDLMMHWKAMFQQFDQDRSGTIDGAELHQALIQMGYNVSPQFTHTVAARYTVPGGRSGIQLDRFIQLCTQLQIMTHAFKERDQALTGTVRFNYEDFLCGTITRLV